jgi:hypothetical protein
MLINDMASNVIIVPAMTAGATTASFNGAAINSADAVAKGVQVILGAVTANDDANHMLFSLEESDDGVAFSAYAPQAAKSSATLVEGDKLALSYDGIKPYFRLVGTEVGTFSAVLSAYAVMLPALLPAAKL